MNIKIKQNIRKQKNLFTDFFEAVCQGMKVSSVICYINLRGTLINVGTMALAQFSSYDILDKILYNYIEKKII